MDRQQKIFSGPEKIFWRSATMFVGMTTISHLPALILSLMLFPVGPVLVLISGYLWNKAWNYLIQNYWMPISEQSAQEAYNQMAEHYNAILPGVKRNQASDYSSDRDVA